MNAVCCILVSDVVCPDVEDDVAVDDDEEREGDHDGADDTCGPRV